MVSVDRLEHSNIVSGKQARETRNVSTTSGGSGMRWPSSSCEASTWVDGIVCICKLQVRVLDLGKPSNRLGAARSAADPIDARAIVLRSHVGLQVYPAGVGVVAKRREAFRLLLTVALRMQARLR
ncbi:hypothetical protein HYQ46_002873 [Verticillium longisporum]|nr:hypothetical protein HYQ46_002873 [Verticillium longisporum]